MYTIILVFTVALIGTLVLFHLDEDSQGFLDIIGPSFARAMIAAAFGFIGVMTIGVIAGNNHYTTKSTEIVALSNTNQTHGEVSGGLFVMSGYIDGAPGYSFYQKKGDGYVLKNIKAENVTVYEDEELNPFVKKTKCSRYTDSKWLYLGGLSTVDCGTSFDLHIPKDSIQRNINLDLSN